MRTISGIATLCLSASLALAQPRITVGDVPGSDGNWQYGEAVVDAPADLVQRWFSEEALWAKRFPDDQWAQSLGTDARGVKHVRFRSKIIGRTLTLRMVEKPGLISYDGEGKDVSMQGKIFVTALGPNRTKVILQSTSQVHGAAGIFASKKMRRDRAIKKFHSDLEAVVRMSNAWASTQRRGG